jgi:hypothetical protein
MQSKHEYNIGDLNRQSEEIRGYKIAVSGLEYSSLGSLLWQLQALQDFGLRVYPREGVALARA